MYIKSVGKNSEKNVHQFHQMLHWILRARCLESCSYGTKLERNLPHYFPEEKYRKNFDNIFNGINPVENFRDIDDEYKKTFLEMAVIRGSIGGA